MAENDIAILRTQTSDPLLTKPLTTDGIIHGHKGNIRHADIIGKRPRDVIKTSSGQSYRLAEVTLGEYVRMSKRLVTPIYPADAALIVSLFDIHVSPPTAEDNPEGPQLEILEAGTGHGSLTLHLSRAVHAANPVKPAGMSLLAFSPPSGGNNDDFVSPASNFLLNSWKKERRAVIHTIDVKKQYSKHAEKTVRGFQRGLYADNVDFHVGDASEWVKAELQARQERSGDETTKPFLTYAFLDLPASQTHLSTVASAMHTDGMLIVFNPSITQITECFRKVKEENIPLHLDQVVELGTNGSTGGREWDVRAVTPRAKAAPQVTEFDAEATQSESTVAESESEDSTRDGEQAAAIAATPSAPPEWNFVCRPKVGERITGGGFLGIFRKKAVENV